MIKERITEALAGGTKLTRSQIIAATGLKVDQVRYHLKNIARPEQSTGGRGALWVLKAYAKPAPAQDASQRITAALEAANGDGAHVSQLINRASVSQSQAKIILARGLESGVYAWHPDRSERSAARRRWYLAKYRPEKAPDAWKKLPKAEKIKPALTAIKKTPPACAPKHGKAAWKPEQEVVRRGQVTICPSGMDQRFTFTPPPGWVGEITRDWMAKR